MTSRELTTHPDPKFYPDLEGSAIAVRKSLAEMGTKSPAFIALMQRQTKREISHGIAFYKALLQYPELDPHERDEYKHYALIKDFLKSRGADAEDVPAFKNSYE
ncbi:MAG: hypothetical protein QF619_04110 [Candidatus Binatia bacterium]|jgi:hypothetical protein|nr:hypothetical protein [Candidatus Binatia bacterium]|tara:strand:+ start:273 stop:584 length:312 start_codon:yes stop_codon:yes gene_type:complete